MEISRERREGKFVKSSQSSVVRGETVTQSNLDLEKRCPKCGTQQRLPFNRASEVECIRCGLVFSRFRSEDLGQAASDFHLLGNRHVANLWNEVMGWYEDEDLHEKFIQGCQEAGCLAYASFKYSRVLAHRPNDEIARKMRKRILGLASVLAAARLPREERKVRLPGLNGLAIMLGTLVTSLGLMAPGLGNLTGVGGAMLVLALVMRFLIH